MAIITLDDLKQYLDQIDKQPDADKTISEDTLEAIIPRAEAVVLDELGSDIVLEDYPASGTVKAVYSDGTSAIFLPPHQAGSVSAIAYGNQDATPESTDNYLVDAGVLYRTGATGGYPYLRPQWAPGVYFITAKWGYGPASDSVKEVCLQLAVSIWQAKGQPMVGTENHQYPLIPGLTKKQKEMLRNARRRFDVGVGIA